MIFQKLKKTFLMGLLLAAMLTSGTLISCTGNTEPREGREANGASAGQETSEGSGGEHGSGGESSSESGGEGSGGGEEGSGAMLARDETFDMVRSGARLILGYDVPGNSFTGTIENTTTNVLTRVRIEVHLSNGTELGPTVPRDLAPGEVVPVTLASTAAPFTGWVAHAEVGGGGPSGGEGGGEHGGGGGEHGAGGEGGSEGGGGGNEIGETAMSSPVIPLNQSWDGVLGGLAVSARYDAATQSVHTTVQNTLSQVLCYVQAEPHLKSGTRTVGELGPGVLGHLSPGQQAASILALASEPSLAGVAFDGYVVHMEVFDCASSGPMPHTGSEGSGEHGGGGGEGGGEHGSSGEGRGGG